MNNSEPNDVTQLRAISDRAKCYIYATDRPIRRLVRDVGDIERFEGPGVLTSQLRLMIASPPLLPASADILDAAVRVCRFRLFANPYQMLLDSMALLGPVAAAEAFVLLLGESSLTEEIQAIGDSFISVFERYPGAFLSGARAMLTRHMLASETHTCAKHRKY